jgi:hypothetical protein
MRKLRNGRTTLARHVGGQFVKFANFVAAATFAQYCGTSCPLLIIGMPAKTPPFHKSFIVAV